MPHDPTSPNGWKVYDFAEAVGFASRWSGLSSVFAQEILMAGQRYLELAGIAETDPDDDSLEAERAGFAYCLPADGRTLDGGQVTYLVHVTGHVQVTVERILQGECAYLDALGLVEWSSPEERGLALGAPSPDMPFLWGSGDPRPQG